MTTRTNIVFRASQVGNCAITQVVGKEKIDPKLIPFLDDGHWLQQSVLHFLSDCGVPLWPDYYKGVFPEPVGRTTAIVPDLPDIQLVFTGHPDGMTEDSPDNKDAPVFIEVKCLSSKSFDAIGKKDNWDWRKKFYPYYLQCLTYLHLKYDEREFPNVPEQVCLIFKNRDTGQMIGGLDIGHPHPAYEYRENMSVYKSPSEWDKLVNRQAVIANYIHKKTLPLYCDAVGYCFNCSSPGQGSVYKRRKYIDDPDDSLIALILDVDAFKDDVPRRRRNLRARLKRQLKKYRADEITVCVDGKNTVISKSFI